MEVTTAGAQAALKEAQREINATLSRLASKLGEAYSLDATVETFEWRDLDCPPIRRPRVWLAATLRAGGDA